VPFQASGPANQKPRSPKIVPVGAGFNIGDAVVNSRLTTAPCGGLCNRSNAE